VRQAADGAGRLWARLRMIVCVLAVVYLVGPLIVVLIISFSSAPFLSFPPPGLSLQWYGNVFGNPAWINSLTTSLKVTVPAAVVATMLGTAAAYGLARGDFQHGKLIKGLIISPLAVPTIITAVGIFGVFRGLGLYGTVVGLIISHTVVTLPYSMVTVSAALSTFDRRLEDAAFTLGASPWRCFVRVTLPLIMPAVLSGLLFSMVVSFDELIVSLFISTASVRPVTVQMWADLRGSVDPTIAAIAALLFAFSLFALAAEFFARHKSGERQAKA
jgi:putative spermidine/putrescine transport system permease protein